MPMDRWREALVLVWLAFLVLLAILAYAAWSGTASAPLWLYAFLWFLVLIVVSPLVSEYMIRWTVPERMARLAERARASGEGRVSLEVQRPGMSRARLVASFIGGPFQSFTIAPTHEAFSPATSTGDAVSSVLFVFIFLLEILSGKYLLLGTADFARPVPDFRFGINPKRVGKTTKHPGLPSWLAPAPRSANAMQGVVTHPDFFRVAPPESRQHVEVRRGRLTISATALSESTMEEMLTVARVLHAVLSA